LTTQLPLRPKTAQQFEEQGYRRAHEGVHIIRDKLIFEQKRSVKPLPFSATVLALAVVLSLSLPLSLLPSVSLSATSLSSTWILLISQPKMLQYDFLLHELMPKAFFAESTILGRAAAEDFDPTLPRAHWIGPKWGIVPQYCYGKQKKKSELSYVLTI